MDQPLPESPPIPVAPTKKILIIWGIAIVVSGSLIGFLLTRLPRKNSSPTTTSNTMINTATEVGSTDTKTFRDTATGKLEKGGLNGEGTHRLVREGGPSQTVYLISSIMDLDQFVDQKVELWGETLKASKAPWLMDVGRVKILQ